MFEVIIYHYSNWYPSQQFITKLTPNPNTALDHAYPAWNWKNNKSQIFLTYTSTPSSIFCVSLSWRGSQTWGTNALLNQVGCGSCNCVARSGQCWKFTSLHVLLNTQHYEENINALNIRWYKLKCLPSQSQWQVKQVDKDPQIEIKRKNTTKFHSWSIPGSNYRWWKKSCTTWDVWNPVNNGIFTISSG